MRISVIFMALLASSAVLAQENGSPFQFKKPEPPVQQNVVAAVPADADLTPKQRETVSAMIASFAETLKVNPERNVPFEVDGRRYLLLQDGQAYLGEINGQHVVFDDVSKDYIYHNTQDISKIIRGDEFTRMKDDALQELEKLQQSLMQGVGSTPMSSDSKPAELSIPDAKAGVVSPAISKSESANNSETPAEPAVNIPAKTPVKGK